ncbi:MAG: YwbE family protein [Methanosarcina sp.]|nr:YwbE family protein [Methanosarcina sp.]MDD3246006.1 YwbE family protein [Methanosarcina sp.]
MNDWQFSKTGKIIKGVVKGILTNSSTYPHGIKVQLTDGQVGRVKEVY